VAINLAGLIYLAWQVQKVTGLGGSREQ
jgi:hypothetical protein